jgi:hypothetical protein
VDITDVKSHLISNIDSAKMQAFIAVDQNFYKLLQEGAEKFEFLVKELSQSAHNIEGYLS